MNAQKFTQKSLEAIQSALNRLELLGQNHARPDIIIPNPDEAKYGNRRDDRTGKGDDDAEENRQSARPVDPGRFFVGRGDGREELNKEEDIEDGNRRRQKEAEHRGIPL